jgi:hypothetical protein
MNTAQRQTSLSRAIVATTAVFALCALGAAPVQSCGAPWPGGGGGSLGAAPYCGDGKITANALVPTINEECDGKDLGGKTCADLNGVGTLRCTASCRLDRFSCKPAMCGNGRIDPNEVCDGDDVGGVTCSDATRKPGCLPDCSGVNSQPCTATPGTRCGNGIVEQGEACDGPMTCAEYAKRVLTTHGLPEDYYSDGMIECAVDCSETLTNTGACRSRRCGNGIIDRAYHETCDGRDLGGQTCAATVPFYLGGELRCNALCRTDRSECHGCYTSRSFVCL